MNIEDIKFKNSNIIREHISTDLLLSIWKKNRSYLNLEMDNINQIIYNIFPIDSKCRSCIDTHPSYILKNSCIGC